MEDKLKQIAERYKEIERLISDPEVVTNRLRYTSLMKERGRLSKVVSRLESLEQIRKQKVETETLTSEHKDEKDFSELITEEIKTLTEKEQRLRQELEEILITDTEEDHKNVIVEIRAGTGGDEAALFAADIFKMYLKYAEKKDWQCRIMDSSSTNLDGFKQIIFSMEGEDVYRCMQFESGGHRVQRVPRTETSNRLHTSACTVAVLPEAEEIDIQIKTEDLEIGTFRASGPGGQHVNKTSSAVRITHIPSGLVVACQSERSQHRNREMAMRLLRTRLYKKVLSESKRERDKIRKTQIGSGDRSEKIRTYNFPQNRVTDHRINLSIHNLENIINGDLDELISRLLEADKQARLKDLSLKSSK